MAKTTIENATTASATTTIAMMSLSVMPATPAGGVPTKAPPAGRLRGHCGRQTPRRGQSPCSDKKFAAWLKLERIGVHVAAVNWRFPSVALGVLALTACSDAP